jgi:hypothetical protein
MVAHRDNADRRIDRLRHKARARAAAREPPREIAVLRAGAPIDVSRSGGGTSRGLRNRPRHTYV